MIIYKEINNKINTILSGISTLSVIYAYPATQIESYPAAIYFPSTLENEFETTTQNFKTYGYKVFIVINVENTTVQQAFDTIMPNVMDEVLQAFDADWNFDDIGGFEAWCKVDTGLWSVSEEQSGIEVSAEIDLSVKLLNSV